MTWWVNKPSEVSTSEKDVAHLTDKKTKKQNPQNARKGLKMVLDVHEHL